jgi:hypothetical protein
MVPTIATVMPIQRIAVPYERMPDGTSNLALRARRRSGSICRPARLPGRNVAHEVRRRADLVRHPALYCLRRRE